MREIAKPRFLLIEAEIVKPRPGHELVVYERPLPTKPPVMKFEELQSKGRPFRNGQAS